MNPTHRCHRFGKHPYRTTHCISPILRFQSRHLYGVFTFQSKRLKLQAFRHVDDILRRPPQPAVKSIKVITQSGLNFFHLIMSTRILVLGSGGREHALVWKLARSPLIDHIYVCPGNPGTKQEPKTSNIIDIPLNDFPRLVDFSLAHKVCHFSQFDTFYR